MTDAEVVIADVAYGGDGVARLPDGLAVFVAFAAIGDRLRIRITERRKRFAKGVIEEAGKVTVLLDPPRAGCAPGVAAALLKRRPAQVILVSCDQATLARDLRRLDASNAYALRRLALFDMFPQTAHFESVAVPERS